MPLTREQLSPVFGFDKRIHWNEAISRTNDRLVRWVFGIGFLTVHLAIFGTSLLVALCWNLVADPADLRIVNPLRYWGIVAVVHTILAGGGVLAWKLLQMGKPQTREFQVPVRTRAISAPRPQPINRSRPVQPAWTSATGPTRPVNPVSRRWGAASLRKATPWAARDVKENWPTQPPMIQSLSDTEEAGDTFVDVGEATWPESAPLSTTLRSTSEARTGTESDHVVSVDHRSPTGQAEASRTWIEGFIESRGRDKDNRWSWVEAAASNWLSRRDDTPSSPSQPNPDVPADPGPTIADMVNESDQSSDRQT